MQQRQYDAMPGGHPTIINASEAHMALVFVLDVSYSMEGQPIRELNDGLNRFKAEICADKQTRDILDVAIIKFNDQFEVVQDFVPIEYMDYMNLVAEGSTKFTDPIRHALAMVDDRSRFYRRSGTEPYKPWIILVSDGEPLDDISAVAHEVSQAQYEGKVRVITLGVGAFNPAPLRQITDVNFRMEGTDFSAFFNWVAKSMRSVSTTAPGEKPPLPPLEGNVLRDVSDIYI